MKEPRQPLLIPIRAPGDDALYRLTQDWSYDWVEPVFDTPLRLTVPKGFETDGASVPRLLWTLVGITPDGLHRAAAVAHDFIYRYSGHLPAGSHQLQMQVQMPMPSSMRDTGHLWTRKEADRLFARILRECGVSKTRRRIMYLGVRIGGWRSWRR